MQNEVDLFFKEMNWNGKSIDCWLYTERRTSGKILCIYPYLSICPNYVFFNYFIIVEVINSNSLFVRRSDEEEQTSTQKYSRMEDDNVQDRDRFARWGPKLIYLFIFLYNNHFALWPIYPFERQELNELEILYTPGGCRFVYPYRL